jgi:hypothetical protein
LIVAEVRLRDGDDWPLSSRPRFAKNEPGAEGSSGHVHLWCWANATNAFSADQQQRDLPEAWRRAVSDCERECYERAV